MATLIPQEQLDDLFLKSGIDVANVSTGGDYIKPLIRLFRMRGARF